MGSSSQSAVGVEIEDLEALVVLSEGDLHGQFRGGCERICEYVNQAVRVMTVRKP